MREMIFMFWRRRERKAPESETLGGRPRGTSPLADQPEGSAEIPLTQTVRLERGLSRAAAISRVAEELRWRGEEVLELFKEVSSPTGHAVLPIYLHRGGEDMFIEVQADAWEEKTVSAMLRTAGVLRSSEYSGAALEILSVYPAPEEVRYLCGRSPAALFQLDLVLSDDPERPEACAEGFRNSAERHWGLNLAYEPEELSLIEELLGAALSEGSGDVRDAPVLDALARGLGCYAGEILRRHTSPQGFWSEVKDWGEDLVVEFSEATADPVGKARAFLENGAEDSVAYYVSYALEELNRQSRG
jgi:hypothetical protein